MRTKNYSYPLLVLMMIGLGACQGKDQAAVAAKAAQLAHNPAQCPKLADGYYNGDNTTDSKFIEVYNNTDAKQIELNLNGLEYIPVNGKETPQKNDFKLTGACINNQIRIVGKDKDGNLSDTTIEPAKDGGLQVTQNSPKVPAMHYSAAGPIKTPLDEFKKIFTTDDAQKTQTGLPQQGGGKPEAPTTAQPQ